MRHKPMFEMLMPLFVFLMSITPLVTRYFA